ncbi:MAG: hypothetical protein HYS87_00905 [Candidatus Colwellbacteria bacterium]|nr:hypothetical protein [Candidatus Colwellbacteria bacterium]
MKKPLVEEKLQIQPMGIPGLDSVLNGGLVEGSSVILSGQPGTGKTVIGLQWLFTGYTKFKEPGVYISTTEPIASAIKNTRTLGFYSQSAVDEAGVYFSDLEILVKGRNLEEKKLDSKDINAVVQAITNLVDKLGSKRVVFDNITGFLYRLTDVATARVFLSRLIRAMSIRNATLLLIAERNNQGLSVFGVEDSVADGIIVLNYTLGEQSMIRRLNVEKMRGVSYRSGQVIFDITGDGVIIYPKIPSYSSTFKTDITERLSSGLPALDKMLGGGVPYGHLMLISGNTGTGKTTFGLHFLMDGLLKGEDVIYLTMEEPPEQIVKTAAEYGFDLEKFKKSGQLAFVSESLLDTNLDKLLYKIVNAAKNKPDTKRILIDSISSIESRKIPLELVREFLVQLNFFLKSEGITAYVNHLEPSLFVSVPPQTFGPTSATALRLSSLVDGVILARYIEREKKIINVLNILKLRGSWHEKEIIEYEINKKGISITGPLNK